MSADEQLGDAYEEQKGFPDSVQAGIPRLGRTPKGWLKVRLADVLFRVKRPVTVDENASYQLVTAKRNRGGIVSRGRLLGKDIKVDQQFYVKAGDFILSNRQISHGGCGVIPEELSGAIVSNEYSVLNTKADLDIRYLDYLSHTLYFQQICFHSSVGVTVEKLVFRFEKWMNYEIHIPNKKEQHRIIEILDCWSNAVSLIDSIVEKKKSLKRHLLGKLFPVEQLSPTDGNPFTLGEFLSLAFGKAGDWTTYNDQAGLPICQGRWVELGSVCQINTHTLPETTPGDYRFEYFPISGEDDESEDRGWMHFAGAPSRARRLASEGDVLYSTVRPLLRRVFRAQKHTAAVYSTGYAILEGGPKLERGFLAHLATAPQFEQQVAARLTGSSYPAVSASDLATIRICLPPLREQLIVAAVLERLDDEISLYGRKAELLRRQRRGLLEDLLTGGRENLLGAKQAAE